MRLGMKFSHVSTGESAKNAARGREFEHAEVDVVEPRTVTKASDRLEADVVAGHGGRDKLAVFAGAEQAVGADPPDEPARWVGRRTNAQTSG